MDVMLCFLFADGEVETVITYDQGAKWQPLQRPENSPCNTETATNRPNRVRHTAASFFFFTLICFLSLHELLTTFLLYFSRFAAVFVVTVQTSHPCLLQHHHEDERPHAASLTAQCRGAHSGSW